MDIRISSCQIQLSNGRNVQHLTQWGAVSIFKLHQIFFSFFQWCAANLTLKYLSFFVTDVILLLLYLLNRIIFLIYFSSYSFVLSIAES